jgi:hypothetical protein
MPDSQITETQAMALRLAEENRPVYPEGTPASQLRVPPEEARYLAKRTLTSLVNRGLLVHDGGAGFLLTAAGRRARR